MMTSCSSTSIPTTGTTGLASVLGFALLAASAVAGASAAGDSTAGETLTLEDAFALPFGVLLLLEPTIEKKSKIVFFPN